MAFMDNVEKYDAARQDTHDYIQGLEL